MNAKRGKLNNKMLELISAIIKYIDEADVNEKKMEKGAFSSI